MNVIRTMCLATLAGLALSACQTSPTQQADLVTICANPVNRQPGNFNFDECQSIRPSSAAQLQRDYRLGAPAGR